MSEMDYPVYESSEVSAREVIDTLRRRRWTVLVTFALFILLGILLTKRMTPMYRAQASMLIEQSPTRVAGPEDAGPLDSRVAPMRPHDIETQVEMMLSGPLVGRALEKIRPIPPGAGPRLSASQVSTTDIVEVVASSTSPQVASAAANALVDEYIHQSDENKVANIRQLRTFVEEKMGEAQEQLTSADAKLRAFKERHRIADLAGDLSSATTQASGVGEELRRSENELTSLRSQISQLRTQIARLPREVKSGSSVIRNPEVEALRTKISELQQKKITLMRLYKPDQPEVVEVDQQINQLKARLNGLPPTVTSGVNWTTNPQRAALQGQLSGFEVQARGLQPAVARLRQQHRQAQELLRSFPSWDTQLAQLQRVRERAESTHKALNDRWRDLRIQEQAQGISARVLSRAQPPGSPVTPRPMLNLLVAGALGLICGVGAACLREMLDDRIHSAEDGERAAGLPVLGRVPNLRQRGALLEAAQAESPLKESYRRLRARISLASSREPLRSLMVTSAAPGEGKSTTAANLAASAAQQGRCVILVDADMRHPSLAAMFGAASEPGLSDVLRGDRPLSEALQMTKLPNLMLLPAGSASTDAAELLAGPRFQELLSEMGGLADLIILDTPPCLPIADAEVMGTRVDAAVLVVGIGRTDKEAVRQARDLLDQAQVRVLGAVLNRMKPGDQGYYYRYRPRPGAAEPALQPAPAAAAAPALTGTGVGTPQPEENAG